MKHVLRIDCDIKLLPIGLMYKTCANTSDTEKAILHKIHQCIIARKNKTMDSIKLIRNKERSNY